jgi:hypothetical protein
MRRGVDPEELTELVQGTSNREESDGVLIADATGASEVLEQPIADLSESLETGAYDEMLEPLAVAEEHGADRVGAAAALRARAHERDMETLLSGTLSDLEHALETGDWDQHLDELAEVERSSKDRKGAQRLLAERRHLRDALSVLDGTVADLERYLAETPHPPIDALLEAEANGKDRVTARRALERAATA